MSKSEKILAKSGKQVPRAQQIQLLEKLIETLSLLPEIDDPDKMAVLVTETALNLGSCEGVSLYILREGQLCFFKSCNLMLEKRDGSLRFLSSSLQLDRNSLAGVRYHNCGVTV
jgi:hypothetical protein